MLKRELYLKKIRKFIDEEEIKVITGVRRSGKTVILKQIMEEIRNNGIKEENIIYLPLESSRFDDIEDYKDLNKYIFKKTENLKGRIYLFFDEIQLIQNWEKSINAYRIDLNADIYITGSNSKLLSGELATLLSGRYIKIEVYPFSFKELKEYTEQNNKKLSKEEIKELFNTYAKYGGFPRIIRFDEEEKIDFIQDIYNTIILNDIINRNNIRNINFLERFVKFMITNQGRPFTQNSIKRYLKHQNISISTNTIGLYLTYLNNAYILFKAPLEDIKTKNILTINEKYYCVDPGFYELQSGIHKSRGQILESIIFLELIRRKYDVTVGNINKLEVDFICRKHDKTIYIQVSESITDKNTRKREFKPLELIKDNYPKYILTTDDWDYSNNGITHMNIIDFLLDETI